MIFSTVFLLSALASPSPSPSPAPDTCGTVHTNLLATLNRPTIGFSPCAVKTHRTVLEAGYANQAGGQPVTTYPQGFIRYGVAPNVEVDLIGPSGHFDSGFGAKLELWHNGSAAFAVDALYFVPTGAAGFTSGAPTETLNVDYGASLAQHWGIGTTLGVSNFAAQALNGSVQRVTTLLPSFVVTNPWNDRTQLYAEAYGSTKIRPDGGTLFGIDGGLQYLLSPQFEVDAEMGRIVTDISPSHYIGFGFGARF